MGLLAVEKKGSHYKFNETDDQDMEKISYLKHLDFSLPEIQKILSYQRLSGRSTDRYRSMYLSLLQSKKEQIMLAQQKYEKINSYLKETINELQIYKNKNNSAARLGFPISSVDLLQCPRCRCSLDIIDGRIEKNVLIEGSIKCECGYNASIEDGIYIRHESVRKKLLDGIPMPSSDEYLNSASSDFVNFRYNSMNILIDGLKRQNKEPRYILELNYCVGFFLNQYIEFLSDNSTYIVIDYDIDRLKDLKRALEIDYASKSFIFLCCDIEDIPFKNLSIDVIIDYWMIKDFGKSSNKFLIDIVLPFLRQDGIMAGVYPYFNIKSTSIPLADRDYFHREKILKNIEGLNIKEIDITDIGPIVEDNPYNADIGGIEVYQRIYMGKKYE